MPRRKNKDEAREQLPQPIQTNPRTIALIVFALFAATIILYLPSLDNQFLNYDDPAYVTSNAHILQGLSASNISWAITATIEANWHPLTWISHMADVQLFGVNPKGPHAVNIVLHALNVVLLFWILWRETGLAKRSAIVSALFAVHPLNVECVAWVAERKSLLCMFFLLLALLAYTRYAEGRNKRRSLGRYAVVVLAFALSLAAKPMAVTFPLLLLCWDFWPLKNGAPEREGSALRHGWTQLVVEKLPFLAMSGASAWFTVYAQHAGGALGSAEILPPGERIGNAIYSYADYLAKGIWPSGLAVFYPHPESSLAVWKVCAAGAIILAISGLAWSQRKARYPWMGWLWYLIAMLPMIGLVQVGRQAMADRYAYLPFIGLFIVAVWGTGDLLAKIEASEIAGGAITAALLVGYASATFLQIHYWRNSYTLFSHAIKVTERNAVAEDNLADALMQMGKPELAAPHVEAAIEYAPKLSTPHYNLAVLLQQQNQLQAATHEYEQALAYSGDPVEEVQANCNAGFAFMSLNDSQSAAQHFTAGLRINPDKQNCLIGRGMIEFNGRDKNAALVDFSRAARIAPSPLADYWVGRALEDAGQLRDAANAYQAALQLAPGMSEAQQRLDGLRAAMP